MGCVVRVVCVWCVSCVLCRVCCVFRVSSVSRVSSVCVSRFVWVLSVAYRVWRVVWRCVSCVCRVSCVYMRTPFSGRTHNACTRKVEWCDQVRQTARSTLRRSCAKFRRRAPHSCYLHTSARRPNVTRLSRRRAFLPIGPMGSTEKGELRPREEEGILLPLFLRIQRPHCDCYFQRQGNVRLSHERQQHLLCVLPGLSNLHPKGERLERTSKSAVSLAVWALCKISTLCGSMLP